MMRIQYLEIVTPEVDAVCETYSAVHGVKFGTGDPILGGARVAELEDGRLVGVRPPLRETEMPIMRNYILVQDIERTVEAAEKSGAEIALPPMELPGRGICAIVVQGGVESGFWQL